MMDIVVVTRGWVRFFAVSALLLALAGAACAPISYNRYQPAQPMGEGQFKLLASAELGRDAGSAMYNDLWQKMEKEEDRYAEKHPQYADELLGMTFGDLLFGLAGMAPWGALGFAFPQASITAAYGVTDSVDIELGLTTSLYAHAGAKVLLAKFGRGAVSISPAIGYRSVSGGSDGASANVDFKDNLSGWIGTFEAPVLVGWQFQYVSPYFGLHLSYDRLQFTYQHKITEFDPDFNGKIDVAYDVGNVGLVLGMQCKFGGFVLTPELVGLYVFSNADEPNLSPYFLSPGLAIGGQW
jgi:hypothetical protein